MEIVGVSIDEVIKKTKIPGEEFQPYVQHVKSWMEAPSQLIQAFCKAICIELEWLYPEYADELRYFIEYVDRPHIIYDDRTKVSLVKAIFCFPPRCFPPKAEGWK